MPTSFPSLDDPTEHVKLGQHVYEIVPQPLPYLKRHLGEVFESLTGAEIDASNIGAFITGRAWDLLKVFIPDLMPLHEWEGFASPAAMEGDLYDEETVRRLAPTPPQVKTAVLLCMKVNAIDAYKALGRIVDPTVLRPRITAILLDFLQQSSANVSSAPARTPSMTSSPPASPTEASTAPSEPTGAMSSSPLPAGLANSA